MQTWEPSLRITEGRQTFGASLLCVLAVAGAVTLGAYVRIPLPAPLPPITLQTLPVLLAGLAVGRTRATAGLLLYLALGFAGAPIFASAFGPTVGYLLAFALAPAVVMRFRNPALGLLAATGLIYLFGAAWLAVWLQCSPWHAVLIGVLPFLPGDALKAVVACRLIPYVKGAER
jgi:biotin transport system substrate-specific component